MNTHKREQKKIKKSMEKKKTEDGSENGTNKEMYELFSEANVYEMVENKSLQWLVHLERMENTRTIKKIAWAKTEGRKRRRNLGEDAEHSRQTNNCQKKETQRPEAMQGSLGL